MEGSTLGNRSWLLSFDSVLIIMKEGEVGHWYVWLHLLHTIAGTHCVGWANLIEDDGELLQDVRDLVKLLLYLFIRTDYFKDVLPQPTCISHSTVDPLSLFLCLPKCHGDARYKADEKLISDWWLSKCLVWPPASLSPGIFYEDWVCCGFEVLQTCEFPKYPFRIHVLKH